MGLFDDDKLNLEPSPPRHLPQLPYRHRQSTRVKITAYMRFGLTPIGKKKSDKFGSEGIKYDVMSYMAEEGSATPIELEDELHISSNKAKAILRSLLLQGYIKLTSEGTA